MHSRSRLARLLRNLNISPYDWRYTLQLPWYFLRPGRKNFTGLAKALLSYQAPGDMGDTIKLLFAGDIMQLPGDRAPVLSESLRQLIQTTDYFIANCEAPVIADEDATQARRFCNFAMPVSYLNSIVQQIPLAPEQCIFSVANNHSRDEPQAVFERGVELMQQQLGVHAVGHDVSGQSPYLMLKPRKDIQLAICAWTQLMNGERFLPKHQVVYRQEDILRLDWLAEKQTQGIDYLIGLPHWDREYQHFPHKTTCDTAHQLLQQGFDLLVGSHSHVPQPLERINEKLCCYSLGNFCGTDWQHETKLLPLVRVELSARHKKLAAYQVHFFVQTRRQDGSVHLIPLSEAPTGLQAKYHKIINLMYQKAAGF